MVTVVPRKDVDPGFHAMDLQENGRSIGVIEAKETMPHTASVTCFKLDQDVPYKAYGDMLMRAGLNMLELRGYTRVLLPLGLIEEVLVKYLDLHEKSPSGDAHVVRLPEFFQGPCASEHSNGGN